MPIGIGLHPYFPRRSEAILTAKLPQRWLLDKELMPLELQQNHHACELAGGAAVSSLPVQCEFWDWDGVATLDWPTEGVSLTVRTEPSLRGAVLWVPQDMDFFCFEPTSHSTDAFNFDEVVASRQGVVILAPGAQFVQDIFFDIDGAALSSRNT